MSNAAVELSFSQRYQMGEMLGAGGMGTVFRATDKQTGEAVAVKVLKNDVQTTMPDAVERFMREAEALRQLNHPNIVKVIGNFDDDMHHCIVMEYIEGGTLYDMLKTKGRLSINRTLEIALDLADALTRAHRLKIVHRDLKPANVLIAADGTPRLTDFGVAHMGGSRKRVTATGTAIGTLDYMSPEALNSLAIDERADIWSFGVMLFEMLTGQRPFHNDNLTGVITAILTQPVPDLEAVRPETPVALVDLIYRMLVKDRDARLPSVRVVGAELEALLRSGDTPVSSTSFTLRRGQDGDTHPVEVERFQATTTPGSKPLHNLPAHTTPFVGRETEIAEIKRLLANPDVRLVTILGPGGMGKTRLSQQAGEAQVGLFQHGVYFVPLAQLRSAENIAPTVAESVGYVFQPGGRSQRDQLIDYLREKNMLLIFDNFEHILDGAPLVSDILEAAPFIKVMATSRERLNLSAETILVLSGMDFPSWETPEDAIQYSAVQLFMQGARRAQPGFELTAEMLPYVARICRLVEGLPLGILLAAAWVETLTPREIAEEIGQNLDFLESDLRDLPERHRSMRAVFDYSWNLLNETEREAFAKLTVFQGGFERDAAHGVAGASLRTLTNLVNKSLVRRDPRSGRFAIHSQVYQYAHEHFEKSYAQAGEIKRLHAEYFANLAQSLMGVLGSLDAPSAVDKLEDELENVRLAWEWAVENHQWTLIEKMIDPLAVFGVEHSRSIEAEALFGPLADKLESENRTEESLYWQLRARQARMLEQSADYDGIIKWASGARDFFTRVDNKLEVARTLTSLAYAEMSQGRYDEAKECARGAWQLAESLGQEATRQTAIGHLGYVEFLQGNFDEATRLYEIFIGETSKYSMLGRAYGLNNMGEILFAKAEFAPAQRNFEEAYELFKSLRNRRGMAFTLNNLAGIFVYQGDFQRALTIYREAYEINREIGDRNGMAHSLSAIGNGAAFMGDMPRARELYGQALDIRRNIGDRRGEADSLNDLADAALMAQQYDDAERYYLETLAIRHEIGDQVGYAEALVWTAIMYGVGKNNHETAARYLAEAQTLAEQLDIPFLIGLVSVTYGETNFITGHTQLAQEQFHRALRLVSELGIRPLMVFAVLGWAGVYSFSESETERIYALELAAMIREFPKTMINFYVEQKVAGLFDLLKPTFTEAVATAAVERGKSLTLEAAASTLLARL